MGYGLALPYLMYAVLALVVLVLILLFLRKDNSQN